MAHIDPNNQMLGHTSGAEELGDWWQTEQPAPTQFNFSSLLANLGLSQGQTSLFGGENFYGNLAGLFPGVSRAAMEQFVPEFQQQRYDNLLRALQEQEAAQRGFVADEYTLLSEGLGVREGDIASRQSEALEQLRITEDDIERRVTEATAGKTLTEDEIEATRARVLSEYGITEDDIRERKDEADLATRIQTEELAQKLDQAKARYGAESPEAQKIQSDYDDAVSRRDIATTERQQRFTREQALIGEGGAEAASIASALQRAIGMRGLEQQRISSQLGAAQRRYGVGGTEASRLAEATQRGFTLADIEERQLRGTTALARQRAGLEEERISGEVGRAGQAFGLEQQRILEGDIPRAQETFSRALARLGAGGMEETRLAQEEAGAGRAFDITAGRLQRQAGTIEEELAGTRAALGRQAIGAKRQFIEGSQGAREAMKGEAMALRQRGAQTGFAGAGTESLLSRIAAQRSGRALGQMVEQRSQALGDITDREQIAAQRASAQRAELGFAGEEAFERLRGVQEAGQYRRGILGQQLGEAGGALGAALGASQYAIGRAGLAREEALGVGQYQRGTAGMALTGAEQAQITGLGRLGQKRGELISEDIYGRGVLGEQLSASQAEAAFATGTSGQRLQQARSAEALQTATRRGRAQELQDIYGEGGTQAQQIAQQLAEAGTQRGYRAGTLGLQLSEAEDAYGGPEYYQEGDTIPEGAEIGDAIPGTGSAAYRRAELEGRRALRALTSEGKMAELQRDVQIGRGQVGDEGYIEGALGLRGREAQLTYDATTGRLTTAGAQAQLGYDITDRGLGTELLNLGLQGRQYGLQQRKDIYGIEQETAAGIAGIEGSMYDYLQSLYSQMLGLSNLGGVTPDRVGSRYDPPVTGSGDGSIQAYSPFLMNMIKTGQWNLPPG